MNAQRVIGRAQRLPGPQLLDQAIAGDDAVRAEQEHREQRALFRAAEGDGIAVDANVERAENAKLH